MSRLHSKDIQVKLSTRRLGFKKPKNRWGKILREFLRLLITPLNVYLLYQCRRDFENLICKENPDFIICNATYDTLDGIIAKYIEKAIKITHVDYKNHIIYHNFSIFPHIVLLSSKELKSFQAKYPKSHFSIIPNFIPTIPKESTNHAQKIVLSVGRLVEQKGFSRLIEIWDLVQKNQAFREWKLHIVGEGGLEQELREQISAKNLNDSIILKPFTKEIEKEYLSASIYVMTSLYEGFGMVLVESGSFALPSVAFDVKTGPSDIIEDSKTGFLIEDNALESFVKKLCVLMENQNLREQMGNAAKKRMQEKFSKEVIMEKWEELFESLKA
ncbi:glycosyltransferase [Campylobacter cuniculorum]|uniref:Glycosyltransferase n=1 Tax=Campylobacter cuniculorum TaxID=374106 RepID=A0ABX6TX80_9BACT|nr:glycosyltransferase [Campylobacter cuniculorum]